MSTKDAGLISAAASSLNKFSNDGSFMSKVLDQQNNDPGGSVGSYGNQEGNVESKVASSEMNKPIENHAMLSEALSANQLAAKALQLRMKGKHEEADKLMVRQCVHMYESSLSSLGSNKTVSVRIS